MSQQNIEQNFWEKIKRFFEPMKYRKKEYSKEIFKAILVASNGVVHILFLEFVIKSLESWNEWSYLIVLKIYALYIFSFEVFHFLIRKWGWMNTLPYSDSVIMEKYLTKYISMDNNNIELVWTWKLVGIIKEGTYVWVEMISDIIDKISVLLITFLFALYMIGKFDISYMIVFFFLFTLFFAIAYWANSKLIQFRSERYEIRNERLRQFVKIMMSKIEVLQTWKISWEIEKFYINSEKISDVSRRMAFHRTIMKRIAPFSMSVIILIVFIVLGEKAFNGWINLSVIVWLSATFIIMQRAIADALSFYVATTKRFVSIEKMWDFFDTTPQIQWYEEWKIFTHTAWVISLKNISYGYNESKPVFTNFNLDIVGNKITAVVWPSWGGKSTLVKLIAGYIRQDSGNILIDTQNLKDVSLKSYYKDIWYLTQEPSVFDGTIRENLLYAVMKELSKKHIKKVIQLAHCEFIYDLPMGLDTEIGERWVKLSGGQKQRLAIAKIFLKDPKIIILDEPTSALDSLSEQKITEAMHNLFKWRTVLVIAHRLQTVKHADDIIVIDGWKIKERGTHKQLIKEKWFYKQMLDLQSGF